jgi:hypothetical protein
MIYIVDIDQTICKTPYVYGIHVYEQSSPYEKRIAHINKLYDDGHTIIYWTARGSGSGIDWTELTTEQLNEWGCKYHELRLGKPTYDIWIDDKAFNDKAYFDE